MIVLRWETFCAFIHMYPLLYVSQHHMLTALNILQQWMHLKCPLHVLCWCFLSCWPDLYWLVLVLNAFSLEMTTNLQQSITVLHRSLMNIWLFCNWNILQSLSILLLYISIRKGVWVFFLEEMFLAFFRKTAFFFSF